jgi:PAS domain S-box-containing protein
MRFTGSGTGFGVILHPGVAHPAAAAGATPIARLRLSWGRPAARAALVGLAYYLGARIGFAFQSPSSPQSVLWLPNSILLGALLVVPTRQWPGILLAALPAQLYGGWQSGAPLLTLSLLFVTNCADAMLGAFLVHRLSGGRWRLRGLPDMLLFLVAAATAPALVSFADAAITIWTGWGADYQSALTTRVRANVLTNVILVPAVVSALKVGAPGVRALSRRCVLEAAALVIGLVATSGVVFSQHGAQPNLPALLFAPLPFLLWAAVRFGPGLTGAALFVVAFVSSWGAVRGRGPFATQSPASTIASLQLFLLAISVPLLCLAAAVQEREQAAAALREREREARRQFAELAAIYRTAPVGLSFVDPDLRFVSVNDELAEMHGIPAAAHAGRPIREMVPAMAGELESLIRAVVDTGRAVLHHELRGPAASRPGVDRDWLVSCCPVRDEGGAGLGVNIVVQEITERKRAEEAVRVGEERMALAAVSANLGFWEWDPRSGAIWLSDHGRRIWGLAADAELSPALLSAAVHADDVARMREAVQGALAGRATYEGEFRVVRADGETRWLSVRGRHVHDAAGTSTGLAGIVVDVTERKRAELEAEVQRRALAHLSRVALVGELSGALAHELRQPLTAILINAQAAQRLLAADPPDLGSVREILGEIAGDDARAGEVISRLRALLRKGDTRFEVLAIAEVVQDVLGVAHADLVARGVRVIAELEPTLPPVYGDRVQLQQVLLNLVLNACEAMGEKPPGGRRLTVGTTCDDAGWLVVSVVDRGTGISADGLEQVFQPFVTSKASGLGLGLAICRTIVAAHAGRLWAVNNSDGGATFFLALPPFRPGATDRAEV